LSKLICVFDLETTGKDAKFVEPVEVACKFYDLDSLEAIPNGEYTQICLPKPEIWAKREPEAMDVHKIPVSDIESAPSVSAVWPKFVDFVNSFNPKKNLWNAPIAAGYNIRGYDLIIANRMNNQYCKKGSDTVLFSDFQSIDLIDIIRSWFDGSGVLQNYKFDTVREFFGISHDGAHRALLDVKQEGALLMRLLKFQRALFKNHKDKLKNSFKPK
jgi:DNA polymerase III epsilon subunit-like protein